MIEDFKTTTSTTAMCGVPLQFMIQVLPSNSTCMQQPQIIGDWPDGSCIAANLSQSLNLRMVAQVKCTGTSIDNIQILGPSVTYGSAVISVTGTTDQWSSNLTWTPKPSQYGPNLVCGLATDKTYLISNLNCYTILAGITIPYIIRGTGSPFGVIMPAQQAGVGGSFTWSIKFNINPILRPTKRRYVRLFYANGTQMFKMDCSVFPSVTYVNDTMFIVTGNNFAAGSYYWTFDYGVGTGSDYCKPETDAVTDPTFWSFTWVGPTTTILSTQTFPPGGTVGTSGASPTSQPILPIGVTTTTRILTTSTPSTTKPILPIGVTTTSTTSTKTITTTSISTTSKPILSIGVTTTSITSTTTNTITGISTTLTLLLTQLMNLLTTKNRGIASSTVSSVFVHMLSYLFLFFHNFS